MDLGRPTAGLDAGGSGCPDPLLLNGLPALPVAIAHPIVLTAAERRRLKKAAYGHRTPHRDRLRAQIVLQAARGAGQRSDRPRNGSAPGHRAHLAGPLR